MVVVRLATLRDLTGITVMAYKEESGTHLALHITHPWEAEHHECAGLRPNV